MIAPQQPVAAPAPMAPAPAAPPVQQQAPAPQDQQQPPQDQGGQSATDAAMGDPEAWQAAAEADARYMVVQRPMNGQVG